MARPIFYTAKVLGLVHPDKVEFPHLIPQIIHLLNDVWRLVIKTTLTLFAISFLMVTPSHSVAQRYAPNTVTVRYQASFTVEQLIAVLDGPPEMLPSYASPGLSGRETYIELNLGLIRLDYVADGKDEAKLLSAMHDERRPMERRLCLASFLLDLKNESAQRFMEACLTDKHGEEAKHEAMFVLVEKDQGADPKWRNSQLLRQLNLYVQDHTDDREYDSIWDALCRRVGELKLQAAVEPLIGILRSNPTDGNAATALGKIGDPRAIPILFETVEHGGQLRESQAIALYYLKAPQVPDILLRHLDQFICIHLLGELRVKEAIEPLNRYLATSKDEDNKSAARLALARIAAINKQDLAKRLIQIVETAETNREKYTAIEHLSATKQRWVVPKLLTIAKSSNHGHTIFYSIRAIGILGGDEAVAGLVALLDHEFSDVPPDAKSQPFDVDRIIIRALHKATGKDFGSDVQAWREFLE